MKHPVKTLAALAILGAVAPSAHAVSLKDDVLSITPSVRIQTRAQISDATDTNGGEYRIQGGTPDAENDAIDFSLRRARLGLAFKYGANWKGQFTVMADQVDSANFNTNRGVNIRYAWLERNFAFSDGMSAAIKFGLDKAEQNPDRISSSRQLFPNGIASHEANGLNPRGVGIAGKFLHPVFAIVADLQNVATTRDATGTNANEAEGIFYGAKLEFSFSPDWFIAKRSESFLAKEGHGLNIGLGIGMNNEGRVIDAGAAGGNQEGSQDTTAYTIDAMFWLNGISAFAEYRAVTVESEPNAAVAATADIDREYITIQAAYAFPVGDEVLEPALRYQIIDNNTDADETAPYGNNTDSGASGTQIDIGLNYYLSGHDNKLSLALSLWEAEEGDADATIIRLQHQINF